MQTITTMNQPTRLALGLYETHYNLDARPGVIVLIGDTLREGYDFGTLDDFGNVRPFSDDGFQALEISLAN